MSEIADMLAPALLVLAIVCGRLLLTTQQGVRRDAQVFGIISAFGSVRERARADPRVLIAWFGVAERARRAFPEAFAVLEPEGARFPFGAAEIEAAHARWTAEWLTWERDHDAEYQRRSDEIDAALVAATGESAQAGRSAHDRLEREKLERYQRRYEEYVQVSKALADLAGTQ